MNIMGRPKTICIQSSIKCELNIFFIIDNQITKNMNTPNSHCINLVILEIGKNLKPQQLG